MGALANRGASRTGIRVVTAFMMGMGDEVLQAREERRMFDGLEEVGASLGPVCQAPDPTSRNHLQIPYPWKVKQRIIIRTNEEIKNIR
jgi:hypothetical protein